jgi:hypothetical protein
MLRLFAVLATHTATPDSYYFCVWDGFADANVNVDDDAEYIDDENTGASLEPPGVPGWHPNPLDPPRCRMCRRLWCPIAANRSLSRFVSLGP